MKYDEIKEKIKDLSKEILESLIEKNDGNKNAFNVFNILNLKEDSHSELLKWLFYVKGKDENSIQYAFMKEFITYLVDMAYIPDNVEIEKFVTLLSNDIDVQVQYTCKIEGTTNKYIDILFSSENAKFICVIENKLDAGINTDERGVTQLEHYVNYINNDQTYKDYKKLFLFLSPMTDKLENKFCKTVCKWNKWNQVKCMGNDFTNRKFRCLLKELGYKTIEYSDIVLFIYKALKKININSKKDYFEYYFKKFSELIIEANKSYKIEDGNKTGNFNIQLKAIMNDVQNNKNSSEMFKYILNQYIEYWEFFAEYIGGGYSRIVDVEYKDEKYSVFKTDLEKILEEKISK